jgi:hypothetical protein
MDYNYMVCGFNTKIGTQYNHEHQPLIKLHGADDVRATSKLHDGNH